MPIRRPNLPARPAGTPRRGRPLGRAAAAVAVLVGALALTGAGRAGASSPGRLVAGEFSSCVTVSDGSVRCWGNNLRGQLGAGTFSLAYSAAPVVVAGLSGASELALGALHACARLTNGTVRCWGLNEYGQLGDGTTANRPAPVLVRNADGSPLNGVAQVTTGLTHSCARMTNGTVRCWGLNDLGQLGDGSAPRPLLRRAVPVFVRTSTGAPLTGVSSISAGMTHTCARMTNSTARCWGYNPHGELGDGTFLDRSRPVFVRTPSGAPLTGVAQISAGTLHSCARMTDGTARCWGQNTSGELGDGGGAPSRTRAVTVLGPGARPLTGVAQIGAGGFHTCARTTRGTVQCWGSNFNGNLGDGTTVDRTAPVTVRNPGGAPLSGVTAVAVGFNHTCARIANGTLRCWGTNGRGQLGDGTTTDRSAPVAVVGGGPLPGAG